MSTQKLFEEVLNRNKVLDELKILYLKNAENHFVDKEMEYLEFSEYQISVFDSAVRRALENRTFYFFSISASDHNKITVKHFSETLGWCYNDINMKHIRFKE